MEVIMANGKMGISTFERKGNYFSNYCQNPSSLHGFSILQKPVFGFTLKMKKVNHILVFSSRTPNCRTTNALSKDESENRVVDGGFLEKQFKFQPTFDDYLKFMESVRTGREKNPTQDVNGYKSKNKARRKDTLRTTLSEDDENMKLGGLELLLPQVKKADSMERNELSEKSRGKGREGSGRGKQVYRERQNRDLKDIYLGDFREGLSEKSSVRSAQDSNQYKLDRRETDRDSKVKTELGGDGGHGNLEKINVRRIKDQARSVEQKMTESGFDKLMKDRRVQESRGKSNSVKKGGSNLGFIGRELGQNESSIELQKKQVNQNVLWVNPRVNSVEKTVDLSGISKRVPERIKFYRNDAERKQNESETNRENFYRTNVERKMGETKTSKGMYGKELFHRNRAERKMGDSDITNSVMEREKSIRNKMHLKLDENTFDREKLGPKSTERRGRLDRGHSKAEKDTRYEISPNHLKVSRGSKTFMENINENDLEMERAAFTSFEVFTDVRDRPRVSRMEMEEKIQKLAKWLNATDINLPEWLFSKMMRSAKIRFTDHSILRIIQILGALGNWRRVLQVIEWLQSRERFKSHKSRYIYTAALDVLGKAKRPVEALNVFRVMQQQLSSYPDLATYHCIAVTLGQAGHMKELFDVIDCMRSPPQKKFKTGVLEKWDPRLEPDIVVYNAVLNACVRRKQWEGAFWVLQELKQQSLQPSSTTYGLVMEVMLSCGKYNLVHEFFRKVKKSSIPNALNYKVLMNTLWREGKTDEAVSAVHDMERRGIVGSASLYYDLARCLCSAGRCQEALLQIDKICKVANKPLVVTYTGLIQACLDSGSVLNAAYIFNQMNEFCSPNLVTCNIMLKAYLGHKMFEEAKDLFRKVSEDSDHISSKTNYKNRVIPDIYTFNTMLDACIAEKRWDDFKSVYQQMLQHGYHFNAKRHLRMILDACRAGKGELLETTWEHLVQSDRIPPPLITKERFCMKLEEPDYAAAITCIASHTASELQAFSKKAWLDLFKANAHRFQKNTLVRLIHEVSILDAGYDSPQPIFQNLIASCRDFISSHMTIAGINPTENGRTLLLCEKS